jgi:hypothetical protein
VWCVSVCDGTTLYLRACCWYAGRKKDVVEVVGGRWERERAAQMKAK